MANLSRADTAEWAEITISQLEYLTKAGVITPDVGGQRKRFSIAEARLVVIAGRMLTYGLTPRALIEPIGWLRNYASWPSVELPKSLSEISLREFTERMRPLTDIPTRIDFLAQRLFASGIGNEVILPSNDEYDEMKVRFETAKKSDVEIDRNRAIDAEARAQDLLAQPQTWSIETMNQVRQALEFEMACRDKAELFFHVATGVDTWKTFVGSYVKRIDGESAWLVIDVRRLFNDRRALT